ncbi:hypothetical protein [Providencia hangzhouensis]|uniref:hypothetical protein n=1 Tax=Providencia hangzhouensis TaxID=3031799 RepID=UPI0034DD7E9C
MISFCASWCHNCESWKDTFTLLSERFVDDCFIWIDIDEYPELVSEIDLDVFGGRDKETKYSFFRSH